ncbi:flagellar basal body-associated FliL family protein [Sanguibacter antarcticus]|uniref:Flagellar protein FliL n=1 Tax=Sanguibacter antarcticus TaxID=372484 RepID=A0A2A9E071_9MICO|nr:flagellar basal body-associated FliL family protein [Sanguibacter antarcticus]PFG32243.1 flagellar FliL protein [Sanguibacter antarcticus]
MPIEQRVMNAPTRPAPARPSGISPKKDAPAAEVEEIKPKKKLKLIVIILVAVLALAGAGWYFFLRTPSEPAAEPEPEAGEMLTVEAMSINLDDGHYLRLGLGLQLTLDASEHGTIDEAAAKDAAIALFSGRTVAEISDPTTRDALKAELTETLKVAYHEEVMEVFLTDYVTQ